MVESGRSEKKYFKDGGGSDTHSCRVAHAWRQGAGHLYEGSPAPHGESYNGTLSVPAPRGSRVHAEKTSEKKEQGRQTHRFACIATSNHSEVPAIDWANHFHSRKQLDTAAMTRVCLCSAEEITIRSAAM